MSAQPTDDRETLTIEDVKLRAERVRDLAKQEASDAVRTVAAQPMAKTAAAIVAVVAVAASLAYLMGSRSGARRAPRRTPRPRL